MNKKLLLIALIPAVIAMSCNSAPESTETPAMDTTQVNPSAPVDTLAIQQSLEMKATADAAVASGLNPEHGMPGHRCEIAVGAPLSSAPAPGSTPDAESNTMTITPGEIQGSSKITMPAAAQPATQQPGSIMTAPAAGTPAGAPTGSVAAGTNPAHGEPGHDCSIPVGAPLKK
jgi:hypothetical protein